MRYIEPTSFSDSEKAARKLIEIANAAESVQDQRVHIELINLPLLRAGGSPDENRAGLERAIANGWLWHHESGVYVKFTQAGADLFAWREPTGGGTAPRWARWGALGRDRAGHRTGGTATQTINRDFSRSFVRHWTF